MLHGELVSIPYGKGKVIAIVASVLYLTQYQFPMGKVKENTLLNTLSILLVSIPYGKGKDINAFINVKPLKVSIPYGKGKEQHFVLRFYYNP